MGRYLGRRVFLSIFSLIGVITCVFLLLRVLPGDPAELILGEFATPENLAQLRAKLGLDKPLYAQYFVFLKSVFQMEFGRSVVTRQPVLKEIGWVLPYTIHLAIAATAISAMVGIFAGILSAKVRNSILDHFSRILSLIGISMPEFWFGILLIQGFSVRLKLFPAIGGGLEGDWLSIFYHLVLPAFALGMAMAALTARMTRSAMLEVLEQDYIRTARAKGMAETPIMWKHALRNALIPIVTIIGLNMGRLLGGAVIIEIVFARPGLGKLLVDSIFARDYPVVEAVITLIAGIFIFVNLVVDITYGIIDPRVKYE
jgi:peptide/nickel transport system permease protein